jgi:hypothetical protein
MERAKKFSLLLGAVFLITGPISFMLYMSVCFLTGCSIQAIIIGNFYIPLSIVEPLYVILPLSLFIFGIKMNREYEKLRRVNGSSSKN